MMQLSFGPLSTEQKGDVQNLMIEVSNQTLLIKGVEAFFVANINQQRHKLAHNKQHFNLDPTLSATSRDILPDSAHTKTDNSFQGNHQVPQLQPQELMFPNLPNKPRTDKVEYELDCYCSKSEKYELIRDVVSVKGKLKENLAFWKYNRSKLVYFKRN